MRRCLPVVRSRRASCARSSPSAPQIAAAHGARATPRCSPSSTAPGCGAQRSLRSSSPTTSPTPASSRCAARGSGNASPYLPAGASAALAAWLVERGPEQGPLFCRVNKGGRLELAGLSTQALYTILRRLGKAADVASFSPHDLRRTFVSNLLEAGADIAAVQRLAGHANLQTTARYDRRGEHAKRKAIELLHVPYVAGKPRSDPNGGSRELAEYQAS